MQAMLKVLTLKCKNSTITCTAALPLAVNNAFMETLRCRQKHGVFRSSIKLANIFFRFKPNVDLLEAFSAI
jgi:hypothetical protein